MRKVLIIFKFMDGNWKLAITDFHDQLQSNAYIYRLIGDSIQWLEIKSPDIVVHSQKNDGEVIERPTFTGRRDEIISIAKAFVEYANSQVFKNGEKTFVKGKLEATERHLEDMRKLIFKK